MNIIRPGVKPEDMPMIGMCIGCGCIVECNRAECTESAPIRQGGANRLAVTCPYCKCGYIIVKLKGYSME